MIIGIFSQNAVSIWFNNNRSPKNSIIFVGIANRV